MPKNERETRVEFINNSRELLKKDISIREKREETEKMKELIQMEQEKLEDAQNSF